MNLHNLLHIPKHVYLLTIASMGLCITSCSNEDVISLNKTGLLSMSIKADSKISAEMIGNSTNETPNLNEFGDFDPSDYEKYSIQIMQGDDEVKLFPSFSSIPESLTLLQGNYTLIARLGYLFPANFEAPYFEGKSDFTISDGELTKVSVTTSLANTKVSVSCSDVFKESYEDYIIKFSTPFLGNDSLTYKKTETRSVYFQSDDEGTPLEMTVFVKPYGSEWLKAKQTTTIKPKDFVRYNLKTTSEDLLGKLGVEVTIDKTTIDTTLNFNLSGIYLPLSAPSLELSHSSVSTYEGLSTNLDISVDAPAGMKNCLFYVNSSSLQNQGYKSVYDLSSLTDEDKEFLENKGLKFQNISLHSNSGLIELDEFISNLALTGDESENFDFSIIVKDPLPIMGKSDSIPFTVQVQKPEFNLSMSSADVWAQKMYVKAVIADNKGDVNHISGFNYKKTNGEISFIPASYTANDAQAILTGLTPDESYTIEAVYGNHVSLSETFTTEKLLDVTDGDMEVWSTKKRTGLLNGALLWGKKDLTAYYPYTDVSSCYWTCVNQKTFESNPDVKSTYNIVPSMTQVTGRSGFAALIRTVGWDTGSGGNSGISLYHVAAGRLFMGSYSYDHSKNKETYNYGQPFTSRPTSVSAYLKYTPYNSDKYKVWAVVENRENNVTTQLGYGELVDGTSMTSFTKKTFNIVYTNTKLKATHFYIVFSSSEKCDDNESTETNNLKKFVQNESSSSFNYTHYNGSQLTIDDIHLNY